MSEEILKAAAAPDAEAKQKRKRGRPAKATKQAAEEATRIAAEKVRAEKLANWEQVAEGVLTSVSQIVDHKFPGCGPSPEEIQAVKPSAAWLLDHYLPEESEETTHWGMLLMGLVMPTAMKILSQQRARANPEMHVNGAANTAPKAEEKKS